jgi:nucleoid DNA-binding protein
MATNKNKTVETKASVAAFVKSIEDEKRRKDFSAIMELFSKVTKLEPKMWGTAIVGFGTYHYKYDSGREGDAPLTGMASRVNGITLYLGSKFDKSEELYAQLGKYKLSGGCVHVKKLEDIDTVVLTKMIKNSVAYTKKVHACG